MAEPFLSEIRLFSFNYPPKGWAFCNGQLLPINQNQALYALLGPRYGGNGQTNFALPNLQGRLPIHFGSGYSLSDAGGSTAVTVSIQQMPQHMHTMQATSAAASGDDATNNLLAQAGLNAFAPPAGLVMMGTQSVSSVGGSQPHTNMMPYLVLNFCIALQGIFPSQN